MGDFGSKRNEIARAQKVLQIVRPTRLSRFFRVVKRRRRRVPGAGGIGEKGRTDRSSKSIIGSPSLLYGKAEGTEERRRRNEEERAQDCFACGVSEKSWWEIVVSLFATAV